MEAEHPLTQMPLKLLVERRINEYDAKPKDCTCRQLTIQ